MFFFSPGYKPKINGKTGVELQLTEPSFKERENHK